MTSGYQNWMDEIDQGQGAAIARKRREKPALWWGFVFKSPHRKVCDSYNTQQNAVVVEDELCFPVREAMALCKAVIADEWSEVADSYDRKRTAIQKYLRAVERMKKKAKVKRG